jgi:hypothetical protein
LFAFGLIAANRRREHVERDRLRAAIYLAVGAGRFTIASSVAPITAIAALPVGAVEALIAVLPLGTLFLGAFFGHLAQLVFAILAFELFVPLPARILFLEARAVFAEHAEIMVRELEKIFGLDAVASEL